MQFPAVRALDAVSLTFEPGEVHGLIGENGAGKSTLMRILSGLQKPTSGMILLDGDAVDLSSVRHALDQGIAMIHQELNLVDSLSVAENVFLGREPRKLGILDRKAMLEETERLLASMNSDIAANRPLGDLSLAQKQIVEIAKALSIRASILIMDEPTAVLSDREAEALFALIRRLREQDVTVIYISHRLQEVIDLCDRISILRDGKLIQTLSADRFRGGSVEVIADLASLMVGRPLSDLYPAKTPVPEGPPLFEVEKLTVPGHAQDVSFTLRPGEILGLAGLVGSGRTELAEGIIGTRPATGSVRMANKPLTARSPKGSMRAGIAYVSEDRKSLGLILSLDVVENTTLVNLAHYCRPLLRRAAQRQATEKWQKDLDIRAGDLDAPILYLSGGNQQKVAIAKWLEVRPQVLILDEPTRGVDVGAKREMYQLIHRLAAEGLACVVISSELPEIIGLCHRALVMREGRVMGEVVGDDLSEEALMHLAAGVAAA